MKGPMDADRDVEAQAVAVKKCVEMSKIIITCHKVATVISMGGKVVISRTDS
jgi:hypothetical protein